MNGQRFGTLKGLTALVNVYESYAEGDQAAGKENALLAAANDNLYYRGAAGEVREITAEVIEQETGIERAMSPTGKKDESGNDLMEFAETEGEYAARVCREKGWDDLKSLQSKLDEAIALANDGKGVSVDAKQRERKPAQPKKVEVKYLNTAAVVLANNTVDKLIERLQPSQPGVTFSPSGDMSKTFSFKGKVKDKDVDVTVSLADAEGLGRLIKAHRQWEEKQKNDDLAAV